MHLEEVDSTDSSKELSLWQALRKWPKVSAYCLALTSAILLWGYDMAMNGNLAGLDQFQYVISPVLDRHTANTMILQGGLRPAPR